MAFPSEATSFEGSRPGEGRSPSQQDLRTRDSPLCNECKALELGAVASLKLAERQLADTILEDFRPYTWRVGPDCDKLMPDHMFCHLCSDFYPAKIGAHSAQTFFRTNAIADTTLFEIYHSHETTLLVPHPQEHIPHSDTIPEVTGRTFDPSRIDFTLVWQ